MSVVSTMRPILQRQLCLLPSLGRIVGAANSITTRGTATDARPFSRSSVCRYPPTAPLPLPNNVEDIASSERSRFSPERVRDISGSLLAGATETNSGDAHVRSYDSRGSVNLCAHMESNVPSPCLSNGNYTHFNMPGGLLGQGEKYTAADYLVYSTFLRHYSSSSGDSSNPLPVSRKERLKAAVKDYGSVVIVFHVGISLVSLGVCYIAVTSGVDVQGLMSHWAPSEGAGAAAAAAPFVVAYAVHKVFAPARITITLASVPFIVRYLRRVGIIKKPKSS